MKIQAALDNVVISRYLKHSIVRSCLLLIVRSVRTHCNQCSIVAHVSKVIALIDLEIP